MAPFNVEEEIRKRVDAKVERSLLKHIRPTVMLPPNCTLHTSGVRIRAQITCPPCRAKPGVVIWKRVGLQQMKAQSVGRGLWN